MSAGQMFLAWVGGVIDPAFALNTTGDLWSGTLSTEVDLWNGRLVTAGDTIAGSNLVTNLSDTTSLRVGKTYAVEQASGIDPSATATWDGDITLTLSIPSTTSGSGISLKLVNDAESTIAVNLDLTDGMRIGSTYRIAGQGVFFGSTFTYAGGNTITLSSPATQTVLGASVTITLNEDLDLVSNLASTAGLIIGDLYSIVGIGTPANATFTWDGTDSARLYQNATAPGTAVALTISKGSTESDGGPFDASTMAVEDEEVFAIEIQQQEGEFAIARVEVINPKVGLLQASRKRWCWLSWDDGTGVKPLFHGRLVGVPEQIQAEVVRLQFIARPNDYAHQLAVLAAGMRDLPYFDRVWMAPDKVDDPDAVLETRAAFWHTDRLTLMASASSVIAGEDGTIELTAADHFYNAVEVSYGQPPLRQVYLRATVKWTQAAEGDVDLTDRIAQAFIDAGSPYPAPNVGSLTSDGLLSAWPQAGASIGGGWTLSTDAIAVSAAAWMQTLSYAVRYSAIDPSSNPNAIRIAATLVEGSTSVTNISTNSPDFAGGTFDVTGSGIPDPIDRNHPVTIQISGIPQSGLGGATGITSGEQASGSLNEAATQNGDYVSLTLSPHQFMSSLSGLVSDFSNFDVLFDLTPINVSMPAHYLAARERSETLTFALLADTQLLLSDAEGADIDVINLSSDLVAQAVEADGTLPIGDPARNSYFPTDRGGSSVQFLLLMAASKMWDRARAVKLKFEGELGTLQGITCRKNVLLHDGRLPGGQATGKVVSYLMKIAASGGRTVEGVIGCMIGKGDTLVAAAGGTDTYADNYADNYTARTGAKVDIIPGSLQYQSLEGTYVLDDDGVDLFNMTPDRVIKRLVISNGPADQQAAALAAADPTTGSGKPVDAVKARPTRVELELVPVTGGAFRTDYVIVPSKLAIPQTINLEA